MPPASPDPDPDHASDAARSASNIPSDLLARARDLLRPGRRIVSFSGAGLSAESGIPTFRDAATSGFWIEYDPQKLASPEGFEADPDLVLRWYNDRRAGVARAQPNAAHRALAARSDITNITQNIDDLLTRAGAQNVIQLHGQLIEDRCHRHCGHRETVDLNDPPGQRWCPMCGAHMRPDVVWFGENLPTDAWDAAEEASTNCDVMLVVGTAAEVYPAAGLIALAKGSGADIVIVNTNPSVASALADVELIAPAAVVLPAILLDG